MQTYDRRNRTDATHPRTGVLALFDVRVANMLLLATVLASFVSYLALNNGTSSKGFMIRALQGRLSELEEDRQKLDLAAVAGQSMGTIDGRIQGLGFVPVGRMEFVNAPGGAVAVK